MKIKGLMGQSRLPFLQIDNSERNRKVKTYLVAHLVNERYSPRRCESISVVVVMHWYVYTACACGALPVVCVCPAKMLHLLAWTLSRCTHPWTECVYMWCVFVWPRCSIFRLSRCTHLLTECVYMWCVFVRQRCSF